MEHGNQADRVDQYLAWRTVHALETIANVLECFYYVSMWAVIMYCLYMIVKTLRRVAA